MFRGFFNERDTPGLIRAGQGDAKSVQKEYTEPTKLLADDGNSVFHPAGRATWFLTMIARNRHPPCAVSNGTSIRYPTEDI